MALNNFALQRAEDNGHTEVVKYLKDIFGVEREKTPIEIANDILSVVIDQLGCD